MIIKDIKKTLDLWHKGFLLNVSSEMAYRASFVFIVFALIAMDLVGPLVGYLIYGSSKGIPGWSFMEFLLFQGVILFNFGFWHAFIGGISWTTQELINEGELDIVMTKPFHILANIASRATDFHGITEALVGLALIIYAIAKLQLGGWMLVPFGLLIFIALIFMLSISIVLAALAIVFVKVGALQNIIWSLNDLVSWPISIYGNGMRFFLTFIIPAAISSYWPAAILMGKEPLSKLGIVTIPVMIFLAFSLVLWNIVLKRYQSAGG